MTTLSWYLVDNFPFLWFSSNKPALYNHPPLIGFFLWTLFRIFICLTIFFIRIAEYGQSWLLTQLFIVGTELDKIIRWNIFFQFQYCPIIVGFRLNFMPFWNVQHLSFILIIFRKCSLMTGVEFNIVVECFPCDLWNDIVSNC